MKRLIKRYSHLLGEKLHMGMIFSNLLFSFHPFNYLNLQLLFPVSPDYMKNQLKENFCWFFFASQLIKNNISNEEERFNFDY